MASQAELTTPLLPKSDQDLPRNHTGKPNIDPKKLNAAFKRWTTAVRSKVMLTRSKKGKRKQEEAQEEKPLEILHSVFPDMVKQETGGLGVEHLINPDEEEGEEEHLTREREQDRLWNKTLDHGKEAMTDQQFEEIVSTIRSALATHPPRLNPSGSSGSYFVRDRNGNVKGIFKPKDEEPYGALNPKWTKRIHRIFVTRLVGGTFGRSCLIPNLSYLSEAAASLLDRRLRANIVPPTQVVSFSSPSFYYDWIDRQSANRRRKPKPLPQKIGSLQIFLTGYKDASVFLREHPWPGRAVSDTMDLRSHRKKPKRVLNKLRYLCGRAGGDESDDEEEIGGNVEHGRNSGSGNGTGGVFDTLHGRDSPSQTWSWSLMRGGTEENSEHTPNGFVWTERLIEEFRVQLEKLVILDVLMRNTDRGLDNFMVRWCPGTPTKSSSSDGDQPRTSTPTPASIPTPTPNSQHVDGDIQNCPNIAYHEPHIHIAAIDNSLAFPWKRPSGWRAYPYGWLWLPLSLVGQPFHPTTRRHFLPILTSKEWWSETTLELKKLFKVDPHFNEKMFSRQLAVLKGQGLAIVQCLSNSDFGPLDLCRRERYLVFDDIVQLRNPSVQGSSDSNKSSRPASIRKTYGATSASSSPPAASPPRLPSLPLRMPSSPPSASIGGVVTTPPGPIESPNMTRSLTSLPSSGGSRPASIAFSSPPNNRRVSDLPILSRGFTGVTGISILETLDKEDEAQIDVQSPEQEEAASLWGLSSDPDIRNEVLGSPNRKKANWRDRVRRRLSLHDAPKWSRRSIPDPPRHVRHATDLGSTTGRSLTTVGEDDDDEDRATTPRPHHTTSSPGNRKRGRGALSVMLSPKSDSFDWDVPVEVESTRSVVVERLEEETPTPFFTYC